MPKRCYKCGSSDPIEFPERNARCKLNACMGRSGLYERVLHAAANPQEERSQQLFSADKSVREELRLCPHGEEGKRYFHQCCVPSVGGYRHFTLASDFRLTKGKRDPEQEAAGTPIELNDLRHQLCEDCLQEVQGSLAVKTVEDATGMSCFPYARASLQ